MSLINDALQRAKQAQPGHSHPPGEQLEFRPAESGNLPASRANLILAGLIGVSLVLMFVLLGIVLLRETTQSIKAKAANPASGPATPSPANQPMAAGSGATGSIASLSTLVISNTPVAAAATIPTKPPPPKLQGILYSRTQPSAIISGTTVFAGSRFGQFRVAAIRPASVILISEHQTNVLTLE
jgi:hypothetical protein